MSYESTRSALLKDAKAVQAETLERASETIEAVARDAASVGKVVQRSAADIAAEVTRKLREAGIDTDQLVITAREQAGDLQRRLADEVRERPLRAIGFATLAGLAFGLITSR